MVHILDLPNEILVVIFQNVLKTENQRYFLSSISKVCKSWESICQNSHFWHKIDGSLLLETLYGMNKNGSFLQTEELICGASFNLKYSKKLEELFSGMPNLKLVNFSKVQKVDNKVFACLKKRCKKVSSIKHPKGGVSLTLLSEILGNQGQNLLTLDLSGQSINLKKALLAVSKSCFNIEKIILQNMDTVEVFPLIEIQKNCTKIKELRLGFPIKFPKYYSNTEIPGFPLLEVFSYSNIEQDDYDWFKIGSSEFSDKNLKIILSKSPLLKELDLRGCQYVSIYGILSLPAINVENLSVSMSKLLLTVMFTEVLIKWVKSLRIVDLSRWNSVCINAVLFEVIKRGRMCNLEQLNLNNTKINAETVIKIIENCENIKSINLSSCREVGRGCMREYKSRKELLKLHDTLISRQNK